MKAGKLRAEALRERVLGYLGVRRPEVLVRAQVGEDSAVIDLGGELCVLSTDPITGASAEIGWLAVHVSCNDLAAMGAQPVGVQTLLLLPEGVTEEGIEGIMAQVDAAARQLGIEVLGGHTEITGKVSEPVVAVTALGRVKKESLVTSGGARPGDKILMTKGVGLEGTAILAREYAHLLSHLEPQVLHRAQEFVQEISVVTEGVTAAKFGATALHDATEGGVYGAVWEMAQASQVGFVIWEDACLLRPETQAICQALEIDPYWLISSGSLIMTTSKPEELTTILAWLGIKVATIGEIRSQGASILRGGQEVAFPAGTEDSLWQFLNR